MCANDVSMFNESFVPTVSANVKKKEKQVVSSRHVSIYIYIFLNNSR